MTTLVTSLRLDPGAAEVLIVPHWTLRALAVATRGLLGRRSYMRRAVPVAPGLLTWRFDDGRCEVVDDETHRAIHDAVASELQWRRVVEAQTRNLLARFDDARLN